MNVTQITKATLLLSDYIDGSDHIVLANGRLALQVWLKEGNQRVFEDIQHVIDWVQVQKIRSALRNTTPPQKET